MYLGKILGIQKKLDTIKEIINFKIQTFSHIILTEYQMKNKLYIQMAADQ